MLLELIETLWNVNDKVRAILGLDKTGINRNIVECKCKSVEQRGIHRIRINRNIVECK